MKEPVFSGPSGRKPGRKFDKRTGDYIKPTDPIGQWGDSLMGKTAIPGEGVTGELRNVTEDDVLRALQGEGDVVSNDYVMAPGDEAYRVSDVFAELKAMGMTNDEFLALGDKERRKAAVQLRHRLARRGLDVNTETPRNIKDEVIEAISRPLVLEKPQGSSLHHLVDYSRAHRTTDLSDAAYQLLQEKFQVFVIEHDWAKAFAGSGEFSGGEIPMPYDFTCFEMRINGMRVMLLVCWPSRDVFMALGINGRWTGSMHEMQPDGTLVPRAKVEPGLTRGKAETDAFLALLRAQVRAVCIMLDAEVAEVDVRRAPERLNRQRERQGRSLLRDYHVVRLAHRHRVRAAEGRAADYDENYTRKRLHFRRGHDRHYPNYKVWIKWQLVGDPDLGFVDKEYRL